MRRMHLLVVFIAASAALLAYWGLRRSSEATPEAVVSATAPGPEIPTAPQPRGPSDRAAAQPTSERPAPPPTDDPEVLAAWFEERVMEELGRRDAASEAALRRNAPTGVRARRRLLVARAGTAPAAQDRRESSPEHDVDWAYVQDVFDGRISGIPNEARAGLTLQELDELGDIPYVEELRAEKRYDELSDLGFENETIPWPSCVRTGTCRRDQNSSPP